MMREQQIETLRKRETEVETRLKMLRERKKQLQDTIEQSKKDVELYNKVSNLLINTSLAIQKQTTERIAQIVTDLYQYVFMTDDRFVIKVDAKRSTPIAQFFIETTKDGEKLLLNPLKSDGGGKVDVIALGLRLAALLLYKPALERVLILDEPFRFLSSDTTSNKPYRFRAVEFLKQIAKEYGIQIIAVTHDIELKQVADAIMEVQLDKNGYSNVTTTVVGEE